LKGNLASGDKVRKMQCVFLVIYGVFGFSFVSSGYLKQRPADVHALNSFKVEVVIESVLFNYTAQLQNNSSCLTCLLLFSSHDRAYSSIQWYYVHEVTPSR
jgi:hypothetical protein